MLDPTLQVAARALAGGAPIEALRAMGQRDEPSALALRGIAMAQLREYGSARRLLLHAIRGFDRSRAPLFRARAIAALAEISVAERDLIDASHELERAANILSDLGDRSNAVWTRLVQARLCALTGGIDEAQAVLETAREDSVEASPIVRAAACIAEGELLARGFKPALALEKLERAKTLFAEADNPLLWGQLQGEIEALQRDVGSPTTRLHVMVSPGLTTRSGPLRRGRGP